MHNLSLNSGSEPNAGFSMANQTWLPVNANYKIINVEDEDKNCSSHLTIYKGLTGVKDPIIFDNGWETHVVNDDVLVVKK